MKLLVKNSGILSIGILAMAVGNYAFHPLVARFLSVEQFGEFQSLLALLYIIGIPAATLGLIMKKQASDYYGKNEWGKIRYIRRWLNTVFLKVGAVVLVMFFLLIPWMSHFFKLTEKTPLVILGFIFLFSLVSTINANTLDGMQRFHWSSFNQFLSTVIKIILGFFLLSAGLGINGAMIAFCIPFLLSYFLPLLQTRDLPDAVPVQMGKIKTMISYSIPTFLNLFFITMLYSWDIILVRHFMTPEHAGQYAALSIIGKIIIFAAGPIHQALFPMAATLKAQGKKQSSLIIQSLVLVGFSGITITTLFFVFPSFIVSNLIGDSFLAINESLGIMGMAFIFISLSNTLVQFFISTERTGSSILLLISVILLSCGLYFYHNSLQEVVKVMLATQAFTFLSLLAYLVISLQRDQHENIAPVPNL